MRADKPLQGVSCPEGSAEVPGVHLSQDLLTPRLAELALGLWMGLAHLLRSLRK